MMFGYLKKLKDTGILGINHRNANYTLRYNRREKYPIVDNKLKTKQLAIQAGIPVPDLYGVVEIERQNSMIDTISQQKNGFVIKPACGSGGEGILVISGRSGDLFQKSSGIMIHRDDLNYHLSNLLSGLYSLGGQPDLAIVEYRVSPDPVFEQVSFLGVPDIRIIVLFGVPVMAMTRLPTRISDGKANLHQGAIGVGIDIHSGVSSTAVYKNREIDVHPDTGRPVSKIQVPHWDRLLQMASGCYELTGLAYLGVDIVLDRDKGPMLLELNARPGLNIQIANRKGLLPRLKLVEARHQELKSADERIRFAKEHFCNGV